MEVYKEHIRDLLATSDTPPPVRLFDSPTDGLVIKGIREEVVTTPEDVFRLLAQGEHRRQVGATSFNQHSSRSHVIVRLWIEGRTEDATKPTTSSSLSLVDLAGSESVRLSGSNERRQEGHFINQSLMTLGKVVYALSEEEEINGKAAKPKKHIPYRDSKLTRLLQPSLSGSAQVVLLCCLSPMVNHLEESHNTFKFAIRAKKIPQKAILQETADDKTLLQSYREEIEDLRQQLRDMKSQDSIIESSPSANSSVDMVSEDEMQALAESIKKLERLILKSKATPVQPEDLLDMTDREVDEDDDMQKDLLALATPDRSARPAKGLSTPTATSPRDDKTDKDMETELARIRGILGSVLKKRKDDWSSEEEIKRLRAQLEEQEGTVSLRKADASFLQRQLEEKDNLLQEVSKLLEAVEVRQSELERENQRLREEIAALKEEDDLDFSKASV
jgi:centromeric protein E